MSKVPVTRVLSVRCNDTDLALCAQFLESLQIHLATSSDIIKNVIAMVASQAERQGIQPMDLQHAREYLAERYGSAGVQRNKQTYAENAFAQRRQFSNNVVHQAPKTSTGTAISGEKILEFTEWLQQNNLTSQECSFEQWEQRMRQAELDEHQRMVQEYAKSYTPPEQVQTLEDELPAGCDPSLPIAALDTDEELVAKAREREREQAEQKRLMNEAIEAMKGGKP